MGKKRTLQPDDADHSTDTAEFRAAMRDVTPLAAEPPHHVPPRHVPRPARRRRIRPPQADATEDLDASMPLIATAAGEDAAASLSFHRGGVRDQMMRRLRRGMIPSEDELDLHGLTQAEARERLADFIAHSRNAGRRCDFDQAPRSLRRRAA